MNVKLIGNTQLSDHFVYRLVEEMGLDYLPFTDGQALALSAIRTCYSPNKSSEIIGKEYKKYFENKATDGEGGSEADRLIRMIMRSGHTSTIEHLNYTFAIEGVSRSLLAQLTRHRFFSFSVQSQRYVKFGSNNKSGGFDYVTPPSVEHNEKDPTSIEVYKEVMQKLQGYYDLLRDCGVPAEDARMVLPNAATCNIVATTNLRSLLDFYSKRQKGKGAQWEIAELAEQLREQVEKVEPWTKNFFKEV